MARDASTAVVIRRGPTRHTAFVAWDRARDRFELGQWLYGRVYERRSDLSPDGRHLVYFAMNGRWDARVRGSWTAVSRAPYLKALTLLSKGDGWHGGGLFTSSRELWINDGYGHAVLEDASGIARTAAYPWHEGYGGECPGVYYVRLQRDGWTMRETSRDEARNEVTTFERRVNDHWKLRKLAHATLKRRIGRGCYFDEHQLHNARTGETVPYPDWEWADVDGDRLVWAEGGRLHAGRVERKGLVNRRELFDFNPMVFERREAPYD